MNMNKVTFKLITIILISISIITPLSVASTSTSREKMENPVYKGKAQALHDGLFEVEFTNSIFKTSNHYDNEGNSVRQSNNENYQKFDNDLTLSYGLENDIELRSGIRYRSNNSSINDGNGNNINNNNSGLESWMTGVKYNLYKKIEGSKLYITSDFFLRIPLYNVKERSNDPTQSYLSDEITLGDPGNTYSLGIHLSGIGIGSGSGIDFLYQTFYNSSLALVLPMGLSYEINYNFEIAYPFWEKRVAPYIGMQGVYSLKNDPYTNNPNDKPTINRGPTNLYDSTNREYISYLLGLNFKIIDSIKCGIKYIKIYRGTSTDGGDEFILGVTWNQIPPSEKDLIFEGIKKGTFDVEAKVIKISPREGHIIIDKGITNDIEKGMSIGIYDSKIISTETLIAVGYVQEVTPESSIVKILSTNKQKKLQIGQYVTGTSLYSKVQR
ncbi:MAG: hypothetical protein HQK49_21590 [Oligoflexia bacterium]|nr:hypothetical protein [Oligoflexia bacterium]